MSDTTLTALIVLDLIGLVGLFVLIRTNAKRRAAGKERLPKPVRITAALLGLVCVVGFPVLMIYKITNATRADDRRHQELVQSGTPATATITGIQETGTMVNKRPQVKVSLTVQPEGGAAFDSQSTWVFSVKDTQDYKVGSKVKVFFDPADHGTVAVVGLAPARE